MRDVLADGTVVARGHRLAGESGWPHDATCNVTVVPTSRPFIDAPTAPFVFYRVGWGSRVSSTLDVVVEALNRGACLQLSGHLCGYEDRHRPH